MSCERCRRDPQPVNFGSPRQCAFDDAGNFTPDNWNCATLNQLPEDPPHRGGEIPSGNDESLTYHYGADYGGWIVLTRYKHRGRCSSAIHVGDFFPPQPVTLALVERFIAGEASDEGDESITSELPL